MQALGAVVAFPPQLKAPLGMYTVPLKKFWPLAQVLNVVLRGMAAAGPPMITKPAVVPVLGAATHMVLFESVANIVDGHPEEPEQVEQVNTRVAPTPSSVSVTFFRSSVALDGLALP